MRSLVSHRRGKYARHRLAGPGTRDVALDATLRAAVGRAPGRPLRVEPADLRRRLREHRSPFAVVLVVDNSYSVQAERMIEKAKGLALRVLEDGAARGDKLALVAFRPGVAEATVALPLTRSLALARRCLETVPIGGRTPLADALRRARRLLRQELAKHPNAVPLVVAVTDGMPNVPLRPGGDPVADALAEAGVLRRAGASLVVADACPPRAAERSCGPALAEAGGGLWLPFAELSPETLSGLLAAVEGDQ